MPVQKKSGNLLNEPHTFESDKIEVVFIETEMNNELQCYFSSKYAVCSKSNKIEAAFTKTEMNYKFSFIQSGTFGTQYIPVSFPLVEASQKFSFWYGV